MAYIGKSVSRIDAIGKVTGETQYPGDINMPDQAYGKILFANRPHAIIRRIDTSAAAALEGVLAIFTAQDVPINEYGMIYQDQPVLCGPGSHKPYADHVRFIGDQVALVVAETEEIADKARGMIHVEYEGLPIVTDILEAMKEGSPLVHPDRESNIFCNYQIRKGDVNEGFNRADVIVESEYRTPFQEHAYLQPEAGIAYIDNQGRVTVKTAGQWVHEEQKQIAHALGLPREQVRVIHPAIGGAFGGREDISIQIVIALAAWRLDQNGTNRPIKIIWSREESIIGHAKRHPYLIRSRWGATKDGNVIAAKVKVIADGGAYAYTSTKVLGNATLMCTGPYEIPNVEVDSYAVYTNNIPGGAFRGFGGPQGAFSAEGQMNKLAQKLGIDPLDIRMRNILKEGSLLSVGTPLPKGVSVEKVLEDCAKRAGWRHSASGWQSPDVKTNLDSITSVKRGIGIACGFKNVGFSFGFPEQSWATVELYGSTNIERAVVRHAGADVGQGTHTVMAQMAADSLGIPFEMVELVVADTAHTKNSGSSSASRMTFMAGNSIKGAAKRALAKWKDEERPAISIYRYRPPATTPYEARTGKSEPNFSYGYVAQAVVVEIDTETGLIRLIDVISANDVGKAINPDLVQGQIEGAIVQAIGYAILEDFSHEGGFVQTPHLSTYLIPGVLDIPDQVHSVILEYPDPIGPWGARGMAEMPFIPTTPAIVAAIHNAIGIWFDEFPLTPERVLRGLGKI